MIASHLDPVLSISPEMAEKHAKPQDGLTTVMILKPNPVRSYVRPLITLWDKSIRAFYTRPLNHFDALTQTFLFHGVTI